MKVANDMKLKYYRKGSIRENSRGPCKTKWLGNKQQPASWILWAGLAPFLKGYSRTGKPEKGNRANQRQGMASTSRKTMHTRTLRFREDRVERVNEKTLKAWVVQAGWIRNKQGEQMKSVSGEFHTEEGRGSLYIAELLKSLWNAPAVAKHIHGFRQEKCTKVTK